MALVPTAGPDDNPCTTACPLPKLIMTSRQWELHVSLAYAASMLSFFGTLFVFVSCIIQPVKRKFPQNLFLNLVVCCMLSSAAISVEMWIGVEQFLCPNGVASTRAYAPCVIQGVVLLFAGSGAALWWLAIVVNVRLKWRKIVSPTNQNWWFALYNIIGWGVPALIVGIALGVSYFSSADSGVIVCFLPADSNVQQYGLFFGPIGVVALIGFFTIVAMIFDILKSWLTLRKNVERASLRPYVKLTFFGTSLLVIWVSLLFSRLALTTGQDSEEASVTDWITCMLTAYIFATPYSACGATPSGIDNNDLNFQLFAFCSPGFIFSLFFVFDSRTYDGWRQLLKPLARKAAKKVRRLRKLSNEMAGKEQASEEVEMNVQSSQ